jgi:hypothetical protein
MLNERCPILYLISKIVSTNRIMKYSINYRLFVSTDIDVYTMLRRLNQAEERTLIFLSRHQNAGKIIINKNVS